MESDSKKKREKKADRDQMLELNFVPTWARQSPGENPYLNQAFDQSEGRRERGRGRDGGRNRDRGGGDRRRDSDRGRPGGRRPDRDRNRDRNRGQSKDGRRSDQPNRERQGGAPQPSREATSENRGRRGQGQGQDGRQQRRGGDRNRRGPNNRQGPQLPEALRLDVSFIPDTDSLGHLVKEFRATMRAYPLHHIADLFVTHHDRYKVKLEARAKSNPKKSESLYQCTNTGMVFVQREACVSHVLNSQLDNYFEKQETATEGPRGNFVCVARCGFSGELLGPPNYHGYKQAIQDLWRSRFQHIDFDRYLSKIETLRDEEMIEQWKTRLTTKTVYTLKQRKPGGKKEPEAAADTPAEEEQAEPAAEPEAGGGARGRTDRSKRRTRGPGHRRIGNRRIGIRRIGTEFRRRTGGATSASRTGTEQWRSRGI